MSASNKALDVPIPRIQEQIFEVVKLVLQERVSERIVEQNEDVPMPWIKEEFVEFVEFVGVLFLLVWVHVVRLILLEHTQQVDPGDV